MTMSKTKLISSLVFCILLFASWMYGENQERIIIITPLNPIKKVNPDYPEILKKEGVAARFLIMIRVDSKGNVTRASMWKSLYPKLEKKIKEVFAQWTFEPLIYGGEPINSSGFIWLIFYPGKSSPQARKSESVIESLEEEPAVVPDEELQMVLDKSAEYCLKLSESALYYICNEKIREKFKRIEGPAGTSIVNPRAFIRGGEMGAISFSYLWLGGTKKHVYVYDYQLIKKEDNIEEKRVLMEKDGKDVKIEDIPQGTKLFYTLKPVLVPVQILGIEHRSRFSFKLVGDKKINGKLAYVIEACQRPGQTGYFRRGRIWVDKSDFQIVKVEVETDFLEGFEQIFAECYRYYLKPHFKSTHYYEIDKNGLLFPSRSKIRIEYSGFFRKRRGLKSEINVTYRNYQFFTVKVDHDIIKKKIEALFSTRSKLTVKNLIRFLPNILRYF